MLKQLEFRNYRCFDEHLLPLEERTVLVGRNNAGKSTVIEGLRLVSLITERYRNLNFRSVPDWLDIPRAHRGVKISTSGINISWENLFHQYSGPPAHIRATLSDGYEITLYLGPEGSMHGVITDQDGRPVQTKGQAREVRLPRLSVLPQVAPLAKEEEILSSDYVGANLSSYLAPLHFRNQLNLLYDDHFEDFRALVEATWHGLQILELEGRGGLPRTPLSLLVRDGDFVAEVAWMGHGLQMWLQTMWFLVRTSRDATVVLDEPDVYMHPDLQRRLLRFVRGRHAQVIVATHSTEILAETHPKNILILDRTRARSSFTTALPAAQKVLEEIGSVQNLELTRLWTARRLILVEGKDIKFLKRFQDLVFPDSPTPLDALPNMPIGGWSGWPWAVGSAMLLQNAVGEEIRTYCILDSDYFTPEAIAERQIEAERRNVELHIWSRKEIENYLVVAETIWRVIESRVPEGVDPPIVQDVAAKIDEFTEDLKEEMIDARANEFLHRDRRSGLPAANRRAREIVDQAWNSRSGRVGLVSGKNLLSRLSQWSQEEFQASFGPTTLLAEIRRGELNEEIVQLISAIERSRALRN